ncbi:MAG: transcription-repair coupling factor [Armatimonadetes bacterium]|nr:transcription-repair coupling factor [Armatimonadota bacterium]
MRIARWAELLRNQAGFSAALQQSHRRSVWRSVAMEARPVLIAGLYLSEPKPVLIATASYDRALQWQAKLVLCGVPESEIYQLPSGTSGLFDDASPETVALSDRLGSLRALADGKPAIIIGSPQAILERTLPLDCLQSSFQEIRQGDTLDIAELVRTLSAMGYEPSEPVMAPGQYSRRGGLLDVFPMGTQLPVRIEFFGDMVDTLRQFDTNSQRSISPTSMLRLSPSRETMYFFPDAESPQEIAIARTNLKELLAGTLESEAAALTPEAAAKLEEMVNGDINAIEQGVFFDRLDLYRPILHPDSGCALDLLAKSGMLVLDEPAELAMVANKASEELADSLASRQIRGEILKATIGDYALPPEHFGNAESALALVGIGEAPDWFDPLNSVDWNVASLEPYRGRPDSLAQTLKNWISSGFSVTIGTDQPTRAKSVLSQVELFPTEDDASAAQPGLHLVHGNLAGGFVWPDSKLVLVTDQELFGVGRLKLPQRKFNEGAPIATVLDLKPGDYVVHINFGIGIFQGLVKRTVGGQEKECLYIQYGGPDKLFVPADQLDRVQKYLNPGDTEPKINRLHSGEWQRAVGKAREEARAFARELIRLYAQRKQVQRVSFGPDSPWQGEMEATFPWMETPSQISAIREVKTDLQTDYPMDRLICGDVGFGKTEVAIRAAFKVAQSGKQVAVLCPTTILSEQHYRNFSERLGAFPTRLEFLNRFRSTAERKDIGHRLAKGEIDIIIGTHALLNQELKFQDLGLVVIDEEHKFGVKQKEALKSLRVSVDVLSMSATPIPRTLSMAMMDIRQMSLINDPPPGRLPIRTYVRTFSNEVVREAILRELARGGQVYYVYNRVQGIWHVAEKLKKLVPMARIGVGHGQMNEKELEPVMLAFIHGELDILLSTTIIENGLDIPNANTMIVENADRFGLSQLYQLRGRVGRSDRQAYAYLLYQNETGLTENALARLQSLQEFSSLGAGYSLAVRDLQIRGAGDLLGSKQSGTMATVGYELFVQIINEEIQFLKAHADGDGKREYNDPLEGLEALPTVDLPVIALIPESYIEDQAQRLYYYKIMMSSRNLDELNAVREEITDRYGIIPTEVSTALGVMSCRIRARELHVDKIEGHGGRLVVTFKDSADYSPRLWSMLTKKNRECYYTRQQFIWPWHGDSLEASFEMLATILSCLQEIEHQRESLGV